MGATVILPSLTLYPRPSPPNRSLSLPARCAHSLTHSLTQCLSARRSISASPCRCYCPPPQSSDFRRSNLGGMGGLSRRGAAGLRGAKPRSPNPSPHGRQWWLPLPGPAQSHGRARAVCVFVVFAGYGKGGGRLAAVRARKLESVFFALTASPHMGGGAAPIGG